MFPYSVTATTCHNFAGITGHDVQCNFIHMHSTVTCIQPIKAHIHSTHQSPHTLNPSKPTYTQSIKAHIHSTHQCPHTGDFKITLIRKYKGAREGERREERGKGRKGKERREGKEREERGKGGGREGKEREERGKGRRGRREGREGGGREGKEREGREGEGGKGRRGRRE